MNRRIEIREPIPVATKAGSRDVTVLEGGWKLLDESEPRSRTHATFRVRAVVDGDGERTRLRRPRNLPLALGDVVASVELG